MYGPKFPSPNIFEWRPSAKYPGSCAPRKEKSEIAGEFFIGNSRRLDRPTRDAWHRMPRYSSYITVPGNA